MTDTTNEFAKMLEELDDIPMLMSISEPSYHGMVEFEVEQGRMLSWCLHSDDEGTVYHTNFSKDTITKWHHHGESWERIICLSGAIEIEFENGSFHMLCVGDEIKIDKNVKHRAKTFDKVTWILAINIPKEKSNGKK